MGRRRKITVRHGKTSVAWEWSGFVNLTAIAITDTTANIELFPDAMTGAVGTPDILIKRIVGQITIEPVSASTASGMIGLAVYRHQANEASQIVTPDPLSTDIDARALDEMWSWRSVPKYGAPLDATGLNLVDMIPVDIKIKRRLDKRHGIILGFRAITDAQSQLRVNLRVGGIHL